jgi:hypothetical protein
MCIKDFLNTYGTNTTNNFDLLQWAKRLGIKPFKVLMANELDQLKLQSKSPIFIICNYQPTTDKGSHWVAMFKTRDKSFYFDSYGIQPFQEAIDFLGTGVYSTFRIQPDGTKMCGQLCLYVLYKLSSGDDFYDIVLELHSFFDKIEIKNSTT